MSKQTNQQKMNISRAPTGYNKRVYVSLPEEKMEHLAKMAQADSRTLSAMAAIMLLKGMETANK